jgi:hypothetical protein
MARRIGFGMDSQSCGCMAIHRDTVGLNPFLFDSAKAAEGSERLSPASDEEPA